MPQAVSVGFGSTISLAIACCHCRGFTCNIITICYYAAPLSTALQVVRNRSSSSIFLPTCIANLVNAALWVMYGIVSGPQQTVGLDHMMWQLLKQVANVCVYQRVCHP